MFPSEWMQEKYAVVYADPPWAYRDEIGRGTAANHYKTLKVEQMTDWPVNQIAAKDSTLFLWATMPKLREALQLIDCWGFSYKTVAFTWIKTNPRSGTPFWGMGRWTRSNAELCLLATKGKPKRQSMAVHSVIHSPVRRHSAKPPEIRDKIVELMGNVTKIELFARERAEGWDSWGNEL